MNILYIMTNEYCDGLPEKNANFLYHCGRVAWQCGHVVVWSCGSVAVIIANVSISWIHLHSAMLLPVFLSLAHRR